MRIEVAGAEAVIVYFDDANRDKSATALQQFYTALQQLQADWLIEATPSYASLLVCYDLQKINYATLCTTLAKLQNNLKELECSPSKQVDLPVCYELGCDLETVARKTQLNTDDVIKRHLAIDYRVYAIGFAPGFAYLGDLDPLLVLPRRETPRQQVAAGSLAIAEQQTAIYPAPSPGGWHIIGRCPTRLFDPAQTPPMPFNIGDRIRFHAISRQEYQQLGGNL